MLSRIQRLHSNSIRREWYRKNSERINRHIQEKRLKNLDKCRAYYKDYYYRTNKRDKNYSYEHGRRVKRRKELIFQLGGKCCQCGIADWRCLQVDHIKGSGNRERKMIGYNTWSWANHVINSIANGNKKYQLLCANCNWIKRYENNELRWTLYSREKKYS